MPAKSPRISVVVSPALALVLDELARETESSTSKLVRGVLEECAPAFGRALQLVRAAKAAKGEIGQGVARSLDRVMETLEEAMDVADASVAAFTADLVDQAQAVKGRRRPRSTGAAGAPGAAAADPRPVTRGSGVSPERNGRGVGPGRRGR